MSAFICTDRHINLLVQFAVEYGVIRPGFAQSAAEILLKENIRSVNHRYRKQTPARPIEYAEDPEFEQFSAYDCVNLCECYGYQAGEHPDWEEAGAHRLIQTLRATALRKADPRKDQVSIEWAI